MDVFVITDGKRIWVAPRGVWNTRRFRLYDRLKKQYKWFNLKHMDIREKLRPFPKYLLEELKKARR